MARTAIMTRAQYVESVQRAKAGEYGLTLREAAEYWSDESLLGEWWNYVVDAFDAGADFTRQGARTLTDSELRGLSRTTRGLQEELPRHYL